MVARDVIRDCATIARAGKLFYPSNEYTIVIFPLENLLRVIISVVFVVDILLQVVVGVGLLKVLAEGSVSRVSTIFSGYIIRIRRLVTLIVNQEC